MARRYQDRTAQFADYGGLDFIDEEMTDAIKAALAFMLFEHTDMDSETIYDLIFRDGGEITWH